MERTNPQDLATLPIELLTSLQSGLMAKLFTVNQEIRGRYQSFVDGGSKLQSDGQPSVLRESIERLSQINAMLESELAQKREFSERRNFKP